MRIQSITAAVLLLSTLLFAQSSVPDEIARLQNSRSLSDGKLNTYLHSSNSFQRARAAIALANIQDTASIPFLVPLLDDSVPRVRSSSAFAIGQVGHRSGALPLLARLRIETDLQCERGIVDALGKCGTKEDVRSLAIIARSISPDVQSSVALSIARFAIRKIKDSAATDYVGRLLSRKESAAMAAYALMRIADSSYVIHHLSTFLFILARGSSEVRMWTATVLGSVIDTSAESGLLMSSRSDPDWRVRVNAVRALKNYRVERVQQAIVMLASDGNEHVSLTAFANLTSNAEKYSPEKLIGFAGKVLEDSVRYSWRQRGEAALLLSKLLKEKSVPKLIRFLGAAPQFRSRILTSLGETKSSDVIPYFQREIRSKESMVVTAGIDAYGTVVSDKDSVAQSAFCLSILSLLDRRDIGVSFSVAAALQDTAIRFSIRRQCIPQLITAFDSFKAPDDVEPMTEFVSLFAELKAEASVPALERTLHCNDRTVAVAAAKALEKITGKNYEKEIPTTSIVKALFREEDLQVLDQYRSAIVSTSKGTISIDFRADAAPFTVLNFILLAQRNFFDGLTFHRVVPNFVVQGGDPLGTGFGGPGYAMRTEVHPEALYSEGAVGMASAGKDTEGSQFFVTHCPTPHLDGRYSVFGYTKDLDVVNAIQVGDTILSVKLVK